VIVRDLVRWLRREEHTRVSESTVHGLGLLQVVPERLALEAVRTDSQVAQEDHRLLSTGHVLPNEEGHADGPFYAQEVTMAPTSKQLACNHQTFHPEAGRHDVYCDGCDLPATDAVRLQFERIRRLETAISVARTEVDGAATHLERHAVWKHSEGDEANQWEKQMAQTLREIATRLEETIPSEA
jgi:hypothetical protein